jgi:hypothetical protein
MKIGMRRHGRQGAGDWIPASAGMTEREWLPSIFIALTIISGIIKRISRAGTLLRRTDVRASLTECEERRYTVSVDDFSFGGLKV